jgi:exodeoxyribonuclease VII large subunit
MLSRPDFGPTPAGAAGSPRAMAVAELNRSVRGMLERGFPQVLVRGEVSNFTRAPSGHLYFALKDGAAQVRCVMWKARAAALDWRLADGAEVEVRAAVTLYEARGEFQLNVDLVRRAGAGALFEAFLRLKEKLAREGLFDAANKRALPRFPRAIGLVTSPAAAALRDVLTTLSRRAPMVPVIIYPTPVQGEGAALRIAAALETAAERDETDVLIVCRGGGSIEDLWAFNEEVVARAIAGSAIPVVSGVGHETDFTIADFVADMRAPTPTAAAELAVPARDELAALLADRRDALVRATDARLSACRQRLDWAARGLVAPSQRLAGQRGQLVELARRLGAAAGVGVRHAMARLEIAAAGLRLPDMRGHRVRLTMLTERQARAQRAQLERAGRRLAAAEAALAHLDPLRVLARGYAVVRTPAGQTVREGARLRAGEALEITLASGGASVRVEKPY